MCLYWLTITDDCGNKTNNKNSIRIGLNATNYDSYLAVFANAGADHRRIFTKFLVLELNLVVFPIIAPHEIIATPPIMVYFFWGGGSYRLSEH